ncbi:MAG: class I adenylate-forming enzyme family protein [Methyloceanibacter sp.]
MSFGEADMAVEALAANFAHVALAPGDCVVIQLPNLVESPLALLAAWRAGLTVAAVPMLWRATELARVCEMIEPAGLIGMSSYAGAQPASLLCDVAARSLSIRFVMGFGPDLPDGVSSLDDAILDGPAPGFVPRANPGPALITFTARAGEPLVPIFRQQQDVLLQGAMIVMALSLDRSDILLNPFPLTGPVGIAMGLAPWLIGGTALVQHDPFDNGVFVQQLLTTGATVTALPDTVLDRMTEGRIFADPQCVLRHVGRVWSVPKLGERAATDLPPDRGGFDLYPLGDLACLIETDKPALKRGTVPAGVFQIADGESSLHLSRPASLPGRSPTQRRSPSGARWSRNAAPPREPWAIPPRRIRTASSRRAYSVRRTATVFGSAAMLNSSTMAGSPLRLPSWTGSTKPS